MTIWTIAGGVMLGLLGSGVVALLGWALLNTKPGQALLVGGLVAARDAVLSVVALLILSWLFSDFQFWKDGELAGLVLTFLGLSVLYALYDGAKAFRKEWES